MKRVLVSAPLDDLRFEDFRFLEEAAKLGSVRLLLWDDAAVESVTGTPPKFPLVERKYFADAIRFIDDVTVITGEIPAQTLPDVNAPSADVWALRQRDDSEIKQKWCADKALEYRMIRDAVLAEVPKPPKAPDNPKSDVKKIVVTGCYDWFHTGHVRFFEECADLGDLYVVVGNDQNVRALKGEHHPLFPDVKRRFIVGSSKYVKMALISSGMGWMDAEPEILRIKPDIYAVNEDGDKPEKQAFCEKMGMEYKVLTRTPKPGLPKRESTKLRGF